jgi:hypothetical protein
MCPKDSATPNAALSTLVLFARSVSQPAIVDSLHRSLSAAKEIQYHTTASADEVLRLVRESERVVLLANCLLKEDIADLYNTLPGFDSRVAAGTARILVLNTIRHPRLGPLLRSRSAVEIIEIPVTLKALQYKLKHALTFVHQSWKRAEEAKRRGEDESIAASLTAREPPKPGLYDVRWQSAYDFDFDTWFVPSPRHIRNVVGAWLIDLLGPGPVIGTWEEIPGIEHNGEKGWAWRPRPGVEEVFQTPGGRWIFFGKQPEFSWQKNLWAFVSKSPMLAFFRDESQDPQYVRFEFRSGEGLHIIANSEHTERLIPRIQATFESRLGFNRSGGEAPAAPEGSSTGLDSWDLPLDDTDAPAFDRGGGRAEGESGAPGWNDHTGAVGVGFRGKDHAVPKESGIKPWRNALTPDEKLGKALGLKDVRNPGVVAGGKTFDRIQLVAEAFRIQGENIPPAKDLFLYDINETGATLVLPKGLGRVGDRIHLRILLDTGQSKLECTMVWEFEKVDTDLGGPRMASGVFRSGEFEPLFALLDQLEARKKELGDFFKLGKG